MLQKLISLAQDDRSFRKVYFFYIALLAVASFFSHGWVQADEHARVVEAAQFIARGYATLPWEFNSDHPLVSFLLGAIHAPVLILINGLGLSGLNEAAILRVFSMLVCATQVLAFRRILSLIPTQQSRRGLYCLVYMFGFYTPLMLIRTSQENWSSTAMLWGVTLFLEIARQRSQPVAGWSALNAHRRDSLPLASWSNSILLGVMIALMFSFRYQSGFSAACLGFLCLYAFGIRQTWRIGLGLAIGLLPLAAVDMWRSHYPFEPAWNYLLYALGGEEGGELWGTMSVWYYVTAFFGYWYSPASLVLAPLILIGNLRVPVLASVLVPFAVAHMIIGHKEIRYFSIMIPYLTLGSILGYEWVVAKYGTALRQHRLAAGLRRWLPRGLIFYAVIGVALSFSPQNHSALLYAKLREYYEAGTLTPGAMYAANSRSGVSLFYFRHPDVAMEKVDLDTFLELLQNGRITKPTDVAIYRINTFALRAIEHYCVVRYISTGTLYRNFLEWTYNPIRWKDVDAIVRCPKDAQIP